MTILWKHNPTSLAHKFQSRFIKQYLFPGYPETLQTIRKISRLFGNFPGYLEIFPNRQDYPKTFQAIKKTFRTIQKLYWLSRNFPDHPENIQTIWKFSSRSENFPVQFQGLRAKTFRMAMPPCHQGFWASGVADSRIFMIILIFLAKDLDRLDGLAC